MPRKTMAPKVSASALPRFATNPLGSSCSCATWIPVISAAMPPDALHNANTIAMTSVIDTLAVFGVDDRRELELEERLDLFG